MLDIKLIRNDPDMVRDALRRRGAARRGRPRQAARPRPLAPRESWWRSRRSASLRNTVSEEIAQAKRDKEDAARQDRGHAHGRRRDQGARGPAQGDRGRARGGAAAGAQPARALGAGRRRRRLRGHAHLGRRPGSSPSRPRTTWTWPRRTTSSTWSAAPAPRAAASPTSRATWCSCSSPWCSSPCRSWPARASARSIVPVLVRDEAMYGTGFFPTDMQQVYRVEADGLNLVGTSEVPLAALHMDEILDEAELPVRYVGYSSCFRREAGRGRQGHPGHLPRAPVRQGGDVQLLRARTSRAEEHDFMRSIEEEVLQELGLPYRAVNIAAGDLGAPAAKKYDLEAWLPTPGALPRGHLLLQLHRLPGAAPEGAGQGREGRPLSAAHAQRHGGRSGPDHDRHHGELPDRGRARSRCRRCCGPSCPRAWRSSGG